MCIFHILIAFCDELEIKGRTRISNSYYVFCMTSWAFDDSSFLGGETSVRKMCNFFGSVSSQQKIWSGRPALQPSDGPQLQPRAAAQFHLESKGKYILEAWGQADPKDTKRRDAPWPNFDSSFYMLFLLPLDLPYVNWAMQEGCLFYLRFSLWSSDLPLFYFCRPLSSLSFSHRHSDSCFLF